MSLNKLTLDQRLFYIRKRVAEACTIRESRRALYELHPDAHEYSVSSFNKFEGTDQFEKEKKGHWENKGLAQKVNRIVTLAGMGERLIRLFHETPDEDTPRLKSLSEQARYCLNDLAGLVDPMVTEQVEAPMDQLAKALAEAWADQVKAKDAGLPKMDWRFPGEEVEHKRPS